MCLVRIYCFFFFLVSLDILVIARILNDSIVLEPPEILTYV